MVQALTHVTQASVEIINAFLHIFTDGRIDHYPRSWRKVRRIDSFKIQFCESGNCGSRTGHADGEYVVPKTAFDRKLLAIDERAAGVKLFERGLILDGFRAARDRRLTESIFDIQISALAKRRVLGRRPNLIGHLKTLLV